MDSSNSADQTVDDILQSAIAMRASDIHIEHEQNSVLKIRFRIDGLLELYKSFDSLPPEQLVSQIKVMAGMNISEHRFPLDGHLEFRYGELLYDIRVSSLPTLYGEKLVLRVFNRDPFFMTLENSGLDEEQLLLLQKLILSPSGIILITGPTGSGKTNFLYSVLRTLNTQARNIITLEDPIEYQMNGINQTPINDAIEFSFAKAMRSVLRQDPNVIMLGEIRDSQAAQMAMLASLTGILVLSTFHTFGIPALLTRFNEMGVANSVIAESLQAVISVRLVRKICTQCKFSYPPTPDEQKIIGTTTTLIYKGKGCQSCRNTGYRDRTGIFEVVYFDDEIKASIIERKPTTYLLALLEHKQVVTLRQAAVKKIIEGTTTVEEALRVVGAQIQEA